jgi:hypothetical protein
MKQLVMAFLCTGSLFTALSQDPAYPTAPSAAQNIIRVEYFIDTDPGFGSGIAIPISPGTNLFNIAASINATGLTNGIHRLVIRSRNNEGSWGITSIREFLYDADPVYPGTLPAVQNITKAEYFFDTDPGFGNGTPITITPGIDLANVAASLNTTGLSMGTHRLSIRNRNNEGAWSISNTSEFISDANPDYPTAPAAAQNITAAEYFIDTDPGFGNGAAITITPGLDINTVTPSISLAGLSDGTHRVYLRTRNQEGKWGITNKADFLYDANPAYPTAPAAAPNISNAEYFFDNDPGFGNGTPITITPAADLPAQPLAVNVSSLTDGNHVLYIRSKQNPWSITILKPFLMGASLPLNFLSFTGVRIGNDMQLKWVTDNEVNTAYFDMERSSNGIDYAKIGLIQSVNTFGKHTYQFTDAGLLKGTYYYRLKQVDKNAKYTYSKTIMVDMLTITQVMVKPNPASSFIRITGINPFDTKEIQVTDINGRIVQRHLPNLSMEFPVTHLPAGTYIVVIHKMSGTETLRFIRQ